jgi:hypothetical protein
MPALNLASAGCATPTRTPPRGLKELAEDWLRRNPSPALKNLPCNCRGEVRQA